jgi:ketosteroid isomerase-like protein
MPPADVEVVKRMYEAIERRDVEALQRALADDVEWVIPPSLPWGGTRHGPDEVAEFLATMGEHLHNSKVETDEFIDVGDGELIVLGRYRGEAVITGGEVEAEFAHHVKVIDGHVERFQNYIDSGEILKAIAEPPAD